MKALQQLLLSGAVLRYRPALGFYAVLAGKLNPVAEATGKKAVQTGLVRPSGIDSFGVYLFSLNTQKAHAVPAMQRHPQALPARPAAVPPALPGVHPLRRAAGAEIPTAVPAHDRAAPGPVPAGAGRLDGAGAQRAGAALAGKSGCVGCGACAGGCGGKEQGVTP